MARKSQVSTGGLGFGGTSHRICHTQSTAARQRSKGSSRGCCAAGLLHARSSHSRNDRSSGLHLAGATQFDVSHISTSGLDSGGPCHRIFHSQPAATPVDSRPRGGALATLQLERATKQLEMARKRKKLKQQIATNSGSKSNQRRKQTRK